MKIIFIIIIILIVTLIVFILFFNNKIEHLSSGSFIDNIDKCIYINLKKRKDRKKQILQEFKKIDIPEDKIYRVNAVYEKYNGHIGCCKSHIKALEYAKTNNFNTVIIFEDDFVFTEQPEKINNKINTFFKDFENNWDVVMLTVCYNTLEDIQSKDFIKKIISGTCASAYIINKNYYDTLLNVFKEAQQKMEEEMVEFNKKNNNVLQKKFETAYALDQYWHSLQKKDKWYTFFPFLGKQQPMGSTIMGNIEGFISNTRFFHITI